jgi:hypothetical protein
MIPTSVAMHAQRRQLGIAKNVGDTVYVWEARLDPQIKRTTVEHPGQTKTFQLAIVWALHFCAHTAYSQPPVDYTKHIKPILKSRCYACHGTLEQKAGLRLDTGKSIRQGGDSGPAVTTDILVDSLLIERVSAEDPSERMPPDGEPLANSEITLLQTWISEGAESPAKEQPEVDPRGHWAFRPLHRPAVPNMELIADSPAHSRHVESQRSGNPIDVFVSHKLATHGLVAQTAAPKHVQLRRVHLDLIGLPPTPYELRQFLRDESVDAYEQVVERLLNDPRHGERWGRHWMDVWRYSDWYGRRHVPDVWNSAPQVWRWRDWIVRSLNEDTGYDQMVREMLAGDEVAPEDPHAAVATGYLIRNWYALNPNDWMRNTVEHTGKAFLGLTFNCAHCHDHKYDPITQEDYFRLRAFFEPMYVRQDRVPGEADPGPFQDYEYSTLRKIERLGAVRVFDKTPDAPTWFYTDGDERNRMKERGSISPGVPAFLSETPPNIERIDLPALAWYPGLDPDIQETVLADARRAGASADAEHDAASKALATSSNGGNEKHAHVAKLRLQTAKAEQLAARAELASVEARIVADRAKYGTTSDIDVEDSARSASRLERAATFRKLEADVVSKKHTVALSESLPSSDANRSKRIDAAQKDLTDAQTSLAKEQSLQPDKTSHTYTPLSPAYPSTSTGRRRALAEWIASRDNPLTARVAVNHIWMRHFHTPLVASVYDFGRNGAEPTHPKLLEWLAVELIESGWSMKHIHRLIVTSETYRRTSNQSSRATMNDPAQADLGNRLLWRMNVGRMEAEVIRDSLLYCSGKLDTTIGGQPLGNDTALSTYRRSLYYEVFPEDGGASPLSNLFDAPNPLECYRRTRSIVPQQALALTNSDMVHKLSEAIVRDWQQQWTGSNDEQFVVDAFERILSRTPNDGERRLCIDALNRQIEILITEGKPDARTAARQSVVRALLNHNDFITIR